MARVYNVFFHLCTSWVVVYPELAGGFRDYLPEDMIPKQRMFDTSFGIIPIWNDGKIIRFLLVRSMKTQEWTFPKGHKNDGETDEQTALRELAEETGLRDVSIIPDLSFIDTYDFEKDGQRIYKTVTFFPAIVKNYIVTPDKTEIDDFKWATYEEALAPLSFEGPKKILGELVSRLKK